MTNDELIQLPIGLGSFVARELKNKHGIDKWGNGILKSVFTKEELSKIKELKLENPRNGDLKGIELLPNLKTLSVNSTSDDRYTYAYNVRSIDDGDISCIEKCKNLESLSLINQSKITEIDFSKISGLTDININNNPNLESIHNIDKLQKLEVLSCYGNISLQNIEHLDSAIVQNKSNLMEMNLDIMLFPTAIGYKPFNGSYNQEAMDAIDYINSGVDKVMWSENVNINKKITINTHNMLKMHNTACQILHDILPRVSSVLDTIVAVERYLAENVTYDYESLNNNRTKSIAGPMGTRIVNGHKNGINGTYDCIVQKSCVCQGYTRGERYLLGLRGIKTREVSCIAGKDTIGYSDSNKQNDFNSIILKVPEEGYHSIIRIDDYYGLYSDPCWNACCYQQGDKSMPYTLRTKDEIRKTHTLSAREAGYDTNYEEKRSRIAESLRRNLLFINARANEVKEQDATLQQNIIGMIKDAYGRLS